MSQAHQSQSDLQEELSTTLLQLIQTQDVDGIKSFSDTLKEHVLQTLFQPSSHIFAAACEKDNREIILTLMEYGNWPLLCRVAYDGNIDILREELSKKTDPNITTIDGISPIWLAAKRNHINVINQLIEAKADPNIPNTFKNSPVYIAYQAGHTDIARALLSFNVDPRNLQIDETDDTLLTKLNLLIESRAKVDTEIITTRMVTHLVENDNWQVLDYLFENCTFPYSAIQFSPQLQEPFLLHILRETCSPPPTESDNIVLRIYHYIRTNSDAKLKRLLEQNSSFNIHEPLKENIKVLIGKIYGSLFDLALDYGNEKILRILMTHDEWTPLCISAFYGENVEVEKLISDGAGVNEVSKNGICPLIVALKHQNIIKILLNHNANLDTLTSSPVNSRLVSILTFVTSEREYSEAVLTLLKCKADPVKIKQIFSPLILNSDEMDMLIATAFPTPITSSVPSISPASHSTNPAALPQVSKNSKFDVPTAKETTTLVVSPSPSSVPKSELGTALKNPAILISADKHSGKAPVLPPPPTVLRQSIQKAFLTEVKSFLTSQSPSYDINARWPDGYTPLEIACSIAHKNIMETLVNHKAIVDTRNLRDETPLHFLVKAQGVSQKAIEYLLKKRADPNHTNMEGISPLGIASQTGRIETVAILLAFNANPNTVSDTAVSPICMAASGGHLEVVQLLLANNVDPSVPLAAAAERGDLDMVKFLLEKGANPAPVIGFEKNGNDSIFKPVILQLLKKKQREILTLSHSHAPLTHKSTDTLSMSPLPSPAFTASLSASATPPALSHTNLQTTRPSPSKEESLSPAQKNNPTYASVASSPSSLFPDSQLSAGKMQKPLESSTKKAYKR